MTMKKIISQIFSRSRRPWTSLILWITSLVFLIALGCAIAFSQSKSASVEWLGVIEYGSEYRGIDPGMNGGVPELLFRKDVQIGLRSDGVVVWRKLPLR